MKLSLHPHDVQWFRRQIRVNCRCVTCILLLSLIIRTQPNATVMSSLASTQASVHAGDIDVSPPSPQESDFQRNANRRPHPVPPTGWRRTSRGWEHVSTWPLTSPQSINDLVASQEKREPAWIRFAFAKLRGVPPLIVALLQLTGVAVIIGIARDRRRNA